MIEREKEEHKDKGAADNCVLFECKDAVATITLNRPDSLNALTPALMQGLTEAMAQVSADESIRAVILTGAGRGFCAGADLSDVADPAAKSTKPASSEHPSNEDLYNNAMRAVMHAPVPTIAMVNGAAAGGGMGLALSCDITLAAESAFFVATFGPKLGIVPDLGTTWSLPLRVGRARALGITLLGERISAQQAQEWGLIWQAVRDDQLSAVTHKIADTLKRGSPSASRRIRESIDAAIHHNFSDQLDLEMRHQAVLIPRNMQEGAAAFMEKREPHFDGNRN